MTDRPEVCTACVRDGRRGYCAPSRCYCGHAECHAYHSWNPLPRSDLLRERWLTSRTKR